MKEFNLNRLSIDKPTLMGVATILILCCHAPHWCNELPDVISKPLMMGYVGVDIFLFLSGIGMFYSWTTVHHSNSNKRLLKWYFRRYKRLFIPYLVISIPIYTLLCYLDGSCWYTILENVSTLSYWKHHLGAWFVAMLLPLYILTPLLISCLSGKYRWIFFPILVLLCYLTAIIQNDIPTNKDDIISNISFIIKRLPSFFLGISIASYVKDGRKISLSSLYIIIVLSIFATVVFYKFKLPFEMFLAVTIVIGVCLLLTIDKPIVHLFNKVNTSLGRISLESYLFNIFLPLLLVRIDWDEIYPGLNKGNYCLYILTICFGISLSYLVSRIYTTKRSK